MMNTPDFDPVLANFDPITGYGPVTKRMRPPRVQSPAATRHDHNLSLRFPRSTREGGSIMNAASLAVRSAASKRGARTRAAMRLARAETPACSSCRGVRDGAGRYCRACHADYMRGWRRRSRETPHEASSVRTTEGSS